MSTAEETEVDRELVARRQELSVTDRKPKRGEEKQVPNSAVPLGATIDGLEPSLQFPAAKPNLENLAEPADVSESATAADFMARVVPWPAPGEAGFINLHWTSPQGAGMPGRPYSNVNDLIGMAQWGTNHPDVMKDIYYCLSRQSAVGKQIGDHHIAVRRQQNAQCLKAIWLDVDVKPEGYATLPEANAAITRFVTDAKLPEPSAIVLSGGGVHVYWISDKPLPAAKWKAYAEGLRAEAVRLGLKCDPGLTTDAARVLRVPGTFNRKFEGNPRPVQLDKLKADYDFDRTLSHLAAIGAATRPVTATARRNSVLEDVGLTQFGAGPSAAFAHLKSHADNLADGLKQSGNLLLTPDETIKNCPHYLEAATTHGAHHGQGLWMLTVLGTTWFDDGRRWAHYLSKSYPTYDPAETDAMYDRKLGERKEQGLGWPSCTAFENMGCKLCTACAHKGKITSPLRFSFLAIPPVPAVTVAQKEEKRLPVEAILELHRRGVGKEALFAAFNRTYAIVRYGNEMVIASIVADDIFFMKIEDFHRMFGNVLVMQRFELVPVTRLWLKWHGRRHYLGRGVVFEPGGPLDVPHDMLNLWRDFGIKPAQGEWPLLRDHILKVVCSGNDQHYHYLIRWMAYGVQHPSEPIGVAIAFRGAQGAGKGVVARTYGSLFGRHFVHIANGDQLTGRFNASLATSCAVFLDEALWAGDKKGEGVLKALITEPRLQLEAKFRDPIMVDNRLRIMVASNEDWIVPAGIGDRRWFILDVANTYAGTDHRDYWVALYSEIKNGGAASMFYDLLIINLSDFDVRAVPHTAAKAQQQAHSLLGTNAWLYHVLQEGKIGSEVWEKTGLVIGKDHAYFCYEEYSKQQRHYRPDTKSMWAKNIRKALGSCFGQIRINNAARERERRFVLAPLIDCRSRFATHIGAPNIEWEPEYGTETEDAADAAVTTEAPDLNDGLARKPDDVRRRPTNQSGSAS